MSQDEIFEEVRILVANQHLCAEVTQLFTNAGVLAFGDYRNEQDEVLLRDAFADGVDYVVFANVFHLFATANSRSKKNSDLLVKVYLRREALVKTMKVGAAIKMIVERRNI